MNMPGFSAERSLQAVRGSYRSGRSVAARSNAVVPAIPRCENCPGILSNCGRNGWKPRAVCNACAANRCDPSDESSAHCWDDPFLNRTFCDL